MNFRTPSCQINDRIGFNSISTRKGLFYSKRLGISRSLYVFIYLLCRCYLRFFCTRSYQTEIIFRPIDGTLTDTTTPDHSGPRSNDN